MYKSAAFEQGYVDKLTELSKQADSLEGELAGALVPGLIPGYNLVQAPAAVIGSILGAGNARDLSDEEIEEARNVRGNASNWIPGVGHYRLSQRTGVLANKIRERAKQLGKKKVRPTWNQTLENTPGLGDILTLGLGPIAGTVASMVTPHRSLDEQVEHDEKLHMLKRLLIPGYGSYQAGKRLGVTRDVLDKDNDSEKKDKKKKKKSDDED